MPLVSLPNTRYPLLIFWLNQTLITRSKPRTFSSSRLYFVCPVSKYLAVAKRFYLEESISVRCGSDKTLFDVKSEEYAYCWLFCTLYLSGFLQVQIALYSYLRCDIVRSQLFSWLVTSRIQQKSIFDCGFRFFAIYLERRSPSRWVERRNLLWSWGF